MNDVAVSQDSSSVLKVLDWAYEKALTLNMPGTDNAYELAESYLKESGTLQDQINSLIRWQNAKSGAAGFSMNLGGLITLPVALPANFASVTFVQIRVVAAIAHMCGYDLKDDKVKTLVYASLVGNAVKDVLKEVGVQVTTKVSVKLIKTYLTREIINVINKAIGFRLLTQAGSKGIINAAKIVPFLGGLVAGTIDAYSTNYIGNTARDLFLPQE